MHCVPLAGFCLSLYDLHALNRDVNMIQTKMNTRRATLKLHTFKNWKSSFTYVRMSKMYLQVMPVIVGDLDVTYSVQ